MSQNPYSDDIAHIRSIMEKSSRFLSLSGWAGVLPGIYALIGLAIAYPMLRDAGPIEIPAGTHSFHHPLVWQLTLLALAVLLLSLFSSWIACMRKARHNNQSTWTPAIRSMLLHFSIPIITGGCMLLWIIHLRAWPLIAPVMLCFYGLALIQASHYTMRIIFWLGILEIAIAIPAGIPAFALPALALGFGIMHIIYGTLQFKNA